MARAGPRGSTSRIVTRDAVRKGSPFQFVQEAIGELRKAVWPTREETVRLTWIVILISGIVGAALALFDFTLTETFVEYIIR